MWICIYVYVHLCIYVFIYLCIYIRYTYIYIYSYLYLYLYIYIWTFAYFLYIYIYSLIYPTSSGTCQVPWLKMVLKPLTDPLTSHDGYAPSISSRFRQISNSRPLRSACHSIRLYLDAPTVPIEKSLGASMSKPTRVAEICRLVLFFAHVDTSKISAYS